MKRVQTLDEFVTNETSKVPYGINSSGGIEAMMKLKGIVERYHKNWETEVRNELDDMVVIDGYGDTIARMYYAIGWKMWRVDVVANYDVNPSKRLEFEKFVDQIIATPGLNVEEISNKEFQKKLVESDNSEQLSESMLGLNLNSEQKKELKDFVFNNAEKILTERGVRNVVKVLEVNAPGDSVNIVYRNDKGVRMSKSFSQDGDPTMGVHGLGSSDIIREFSKKYKK